MHRGRVSERLAAGATSRDRMHTPSLELVLNYLLLNFSQIYVTKPLGRNNAWEPRRAWRPSSVHRPKWPR